MRLPARLFRHLSLVVAMLGPCAAMAEPSAIYLVRHGEKSTVGKDPDLTAEGKTRAHNIAAILGKTGIAHIFSTPTNRTRQTAEPLAQRAGLTVQLYEPGNPKALAEKVRALSGAVLVVGHSNTLPELVRLFGGAPGANIQDDEYDRLYQLTGSGAAVSTVLFTSLPARAQ